MLLAPERTFHSTKHRYKRDIPDVIIMKNGPFPLCQTVFTDLNTDHLTVFISTTSKANIVTPRLLQGKIEWDTFRLMMKIDLVIPSYWSHRESYQIF